MPDLFFQLVVDKSNKLIQMLNDGSKKPFIFNGIALYQYFYILSVKNAEKTLFNVIDRYGEVPDNMPMNWRYFEHIKIELNLKIP